MRNLGRREALGWLAAGAATGLARPARAADRPPNLLFVLTDDQRWNTLGCLDPTVRTPRLDALARDGVLFTRACVTTAICCSSRPSILTGQYTCRHGIHDFAKTFTPDALANTYPSVLRRNGYHVGYVGKYGVGGKVPAGAFDFDRATPQLTPQWVKGPDGQPVHVIDQDTRHALDFLGARPADKPFCLTVSYRAPHAQDNHPDQYLPLPDDTELYRDVIVPLPRTATEASFRALPPFLATDRNEGRARWRKRFDTPERYQTYVKNYYRLVTAIDRSVGRIVDELARLGLDRNTVVVFTGDNGYFLGEHGLADKWFPYEESIRVPLIVHDPRLPAARRGQQLDALALNIDLAPTLLSLAGCPVPPGVQGHDQSPLWRDGAVGRREFYYEHDDQHPGIEPSQALVTRTHKYILWPKQGYEELYDLAADPLEERNVVADPAQQELLAELRRRFAVRQREACAG
jgi:arylsulfatase A-like enzyme